MSQPPSQYTDWPIDWPTEDQGAEPEDRLPAVTAVETDRLWVHLMWELVLLAAVVGVGLLLLDGDRDALSGGRLEQLLTQAAGIGMVAAGLACSLRAAAPNLAVGAVFGTSTVALGWLQVEDDRSLASAVPAVLLAAALTGLLLAGFVVVLHVPAWAASLGFVPLLLAATIGLAEERRRDVPMLGDQPRLLFALFVLASVLGGVLCAFPAFRRWFGGLRGQRDPGRRAGAAAATATTLALVVSTVLAALGGMVVDLAADPEGVGQQLGLAGLDATLLALGAVLVGGVSAFGRRGGIFGTVLGVALVVLLLELARRELDLESRPASTLYLAVPGGLILAGLVVNRMLEATGRRTVLVEETVTAAG